MAPFDPLTSWIVALLADGIGISGGFTSKAQVTQYYKDRVKESNSNLNAEIRCRLTQKNYLPEYELRSIKSLLEYYKNRYEYRYGTVELDLDVQELLIKLYKECISEHQQALKIYEDGYNKQKEKGVPDSRLSGAIKSINNEKDAINSYQQVLTAIELQRNLKALEIAEKQKAFERKQQESPSENVYLFGLLLIIFVILLIILFS